MSLGTAQELRRQSAPPQHAVCETYPGWSDAQCGQPAAGTVWVQCATDGPRERGVCAEHLEMLQEGAAFRCRFCSSELNLLHVHG